MYHYIHLPIIRVVHVFSMHAIDSDPFNPKQIEWKLQMTEDGSQ